MTESAGQMLLRHAGASAALRANTQGAGNAAPGPDATVEALVSHVVATPEVVEKYRERIAHLENTIRDIQKNGGAEVPPVKLLVIGGGPCGLCFAIRVAELANARGGPKLLVTVRDSRHRKEDNGAVVYAGSGEGRRRDQVVTLQCDVLDHFSEATREMLFRNIDEEVWSLASNSRNIPIKEVEDRLLQRAQADEFEDVIVLEPTGRSRAPWTEQDEFDIVIGADGSASWTRGHLFGIPNDGSVPIDQFAEQLNQQGGTDYALGIAFDTLASIRTQLRELSTHEKTCKARELGLGPKKLMEMVGGDSHDSDYIDEAMVNVLTPKVADVESPRPVAAPGDQGRLPFSQSKNVIFTLNQTRFLLNASSVTGTGYLNIRLSKTEMDLATTADGRPVSFGNPARVLPDYVDGGRFCCLKSQVPPRGDAFQPQVDHQNGVEGPSSDLWDTVCSGLRFFGIPEEQVTSIIGIELPVRYSTQLMRSKHLHGTDKTPTLMFLVGDAAFQTHFWPGRGMNSAFKGAVMLAHSLQSLLERKKIKDLLRPVARSGSLLDHKELEAYDNFMSRLRQREHAGRSIKFLCGDKMQKICADAAEKKGDCDAFRHAKQQLLDKLVSGGTFGLKTTQSRQLWTHKKLDEAVFVDFAKRILDRMSPQEILVMNSSGEWPLAGGVEILPKDYVATRRLCKTGQDAATKDADTKDFSSQVDSNGGVLGGSVEAC
eukprot:COSAG06_NODE_268_length_18811_cov_4.369549_6_plen_714_part_00